MKVYKITEMFTIATKCFNSKILYTYTHTHTGTSILIFGHLRLLLIYSN